MSFYQECLRIVEDNKTNPRPHLFFMTMCLKHWQNRILVYSNMKSLTYTDSERRLLVHNKWGEDELMIRLIHDGYQVQNILDLILEARNIEWDMSNKEIFDRNHLVTPMLENLTTLLLPIWKSEVEKTKIQKDHPEIRKIIYFTLNLRDYFDKKDNEAYVDFFIKLLDENGV